MKLSKALQMKSADDYAINTLNISSLKLMENASEHIVTKALELMGEKMSAAVFCGSGNNGGDGVCTAVKLRQRGVKVRVFFTGSREKMTKDTKEMERRLKAEGGALENFDNENDHIIRYCEKCGVIIDAMFGIGLNSNLRGVSLEAAEFINNLDVPVLAADIPSGVEADTGKILGTAVMADATVTFSMGKPGLYSQPGCLMCGEVSVCDIGIPADVINKIEAQEFAVDRAMVKLPKRPRDGHKGTFGKVLIVGGSIGYTGAPVLAAEAAVKSGAGLVFLGVPKDIYDITAAKTWETMAFPLTEEELYKKLDLCDVCLIGPGLGRSQRAERLVYEVIRRSEVPLIIDADGINAVGRNIDVLDDAECPLILTPHEGEFARLGGVITGGDRINAARDFAAKHGCTLVLKGHRTVTAFADRRVYINTTGNAGMAKGGSGDVLAGMISGFAGQLQLEKAVIAGVYAHGLTGDICRDKYGEYSMTPSDMIMNIFEATKVLAEK